MSISDIFVVLELLLDYKLRDFKSCMKRICLQKMDNFIRFNGGKFYGRYYH